LAGGSSPPVGTKLCYRSRPIVVWTRGIIVGVSGGPDSLGLAAVLARVIRVLPTPVTLVHVDHGLRPESSDDAERCLGLAQALELRCDVVRLPAALQLLHPGVGVEEAARRERYVALASAAERYGTALVAVAHHLDDQAESVLIHLLRGAGLAGAAAMAEVTPLPVPWWERAAVPTSIALWRPFLEEERAVVRAYARDRGLTPIEDASNADPAFRRNRIRNEVMPILESIAPGASGALARYARVARDEDGLVSELAAEAYYRVVQADGTIDAAGLRQEHLAIRRRVMRHWIRVRTGREEISLNRIEAVLAAVGRDGESRAIEVGEGWHVVVAGDCVDVQRGIDRRPVTAERSFHTGQSTVEATSAGKDACA
jgi:tRNA(Ile)-lysidine synthase